MLSKILNFEYAFRLGAEIVWAVVIAVVVAVAPLITGTSIDTILADPETYVRALAGAAARAAAVAFMVALRAALGKVWATLNAVIALLH